MYKYVSINVCMYVNNLAPWQCWRLAIVVVVVGVVGVVAAAAVAAIGVYFIFFLLLDFVFLHCRTEFNCLGWFFWY